MKFQTLLMDPHVRTTGQQNYSQNNNLSKGIIELVIDKHIYKRL